MRKSLQLQAEMAQEFGACVFDVTLDCEDGAPVGGEAEHAALVVELALRLRRRARASRCACIRWTTPPSKQDIDDHRRQGRRPAVPRDAAQGRVGSPTSSAPAAALDAAGAPRPAAARADRVACRGAPRLRHRGASARAVAQLRPDGFRLGPRRRDSRRTAWASKASSRIRWWCGPSWRSPRPAMRTARCRRTAWSPSSRTRPRCARPRRAAAHEFGYTRMWSIHPDQIRPILEAFAPERGRHRDRNANHRCGGRARLGPDQLRRKAGGPGELPLLLAGAGEGAPDRKAAAAEARGWFASAAR